MLSPFISYNGSCENLVSNHDTPWYSFSFLCPDLCYIKNISQIKMRELVVIFDSMSSVHEVNAALWVVSPLSIQYIIDSCYCDLIHLFILSLRVTLQSSIWKYLILPHHLLLQVIEINISTKHAHYIKWHLLEKKYSLLNCQCHYSVL